jgi:hypothetical protein
MYIYSQHVLCRNVSASIEVKMPHTFQTALWNKTSCNVGDFPSTWLYEVLRTNVIKIFHAFMEPEGCVPILCQMNPFCTQPTSLTSIFILPSHLCLGLLSGLFLSGFPTKIQKIHCVYVISSENQIKIQTLRQFCYLHFVLILQIHHWKHLVMHWAQYLVH